VGKPSVEMSRSAGLSDGELGKDVFGEVAGDEPEGVEDEAEEEGDVEDVMSNYLVSRSSS